MGRFISILSNLKKKTFAKRLLIICIDGIGDTVLFMPSFSYIFNKYNDYDITAIVRLGYESLLKENIFVKNIISLNYLKYRKNLLYKLSFLVKISKSHFGLTIYPAFTRERIGDEIVLWSNSSEKIGWDYQSPRMTLSEKNRSDKIYTQLFKSQLGLYDSELLHNKEFLLNLRCNVIKYEPQIYFKQNTNERILQVIRDLPIKEEHLFAIVPGALASYRKWDKSNWIGLMESIVQEYNKSKFIIVGSESDVNFIDEYPRNFFKEYVMNLCGKLNLGELAPLFNQCEIVLGNETGPMHIAIASGAATIVIQGGGHFGRFMPYGDPKRNKFVYKQMDCFQCDWYCKYGDFRCVSEVTVEDVMKVVKKII